MDGDDLQAHGAGHMIAAAVRAIGLIAGEANSTEGRDESAASQRRYTVPPPTDFSPNRRFFAYTMAYGGDGIRAVAVLLTRLGLLFLMLAVGVRVLLG